MSGRPEIDLVTRDVVYSGLLTIAGEMSEVLGRSAYSPIVREMIDYSCAIFAADGDLVSQAENIPSHLGSMGQALRETMRIHDPITWDLGDAFITNHPYRGGTHLPDIHVFTPVFDGDELIGITANIAHHTDMGGVAPASEGFDLTSIFSEGLVIAPMKLADGGRIVEQVMAFIGANVREPDATLGDVRAQIAACRHGERRLLSISSRYSPAVLKQVMSDAMDYSERRMRAGLVAMPDGEATACGYLDSDGVGGGPVQIKVTVRKKGDSAVVDFSGTDPQMGGGMNVPPAPARSAMLYAFKCFVDPETPQNEGCFRPLEIVLPLGTLVNPRFPAAVNLRHPSVQRIGDTILRALAELDPTNAAAGAFLGHSCVIVDSHDPRDHSIRVAGDNLGGGMGAHSQGDGADAVNTHLGNISMIPAEICEQVYLVRVLSTELLTDSGGPGQFRGGLGFRRVYEVQKEPQNGLVYTEQAEPDFAPWGLEGGRPGTSARIVLRRADGTEQELRKDYFRAEPGDCVIIETGGGGGFGNPKQRDRDLVAEDVRLGKVSPQAAREIYGWDGGSSSSVKRQPAMKG